ncbi:hypothetical protein LZB41_09640, partial [Campylobacter jejuni]|nr:hypothetical protein [Campylobacter jejuni]
ILLKQPVVAATYEFFEQRNHAYVGRTSPAAPAWGQGGVARDLIYLVERGSAGKRTSLTHLARNSLDL